MCTVWLSFVLIWLQRKFVRQLPNPAEKKNFHQQFTKWLNATFPFGIDEQSWQNILEQDSAHPYCTHPLTEVEVEGTENVAPPVLPEFELPEINQQTAQPGVYEPIYESYDYENPE